jgi:DNA-binding response OmpR family regulator
MPSRAATILLIDDHGDSRRILRTMLEWLGHRVIQAANAEDGLRMAETEHPAVIVTEFLVPHRGGCCVVEELKRSSATRSIPVMTFTSDGSPEARERVARAGGIYVAKPLEPRLLCALVEPLLREETPPVSS